MKKIYSKYFVLIILTFITSILIYNYVESFKTIDEKKDILISQKEMEDEYLKNTNYTFDNPNIIVNPYGNSPLTALVIFQTNDLTTASITIVGKDGANDITHTYTPAKVHILPIYGLYSDYDNKVIIKVSGKTKEISIKTDKLPDDFAKVTDIDMEETDEFYFTTPENIGYTAAYDYKGEVRWYITGDYKWNIQRLNNGHILVSSDKTISGNYSAGLTEIDLLGKIYFEYIVPGGYYRSVTELNNGNLLLLSNSKDKSFEDYIIEIDRNTGAIVKEIDLKKILNKKDSGNWFKATSLVYDMSTNSITVSGYNDNSLVNIDYSSLNVNWIIAGDNYPGNQLLRNDDNASYPSKPLSLNLTQNNGLIFVNEIDGIRYLTTYEIDYSNRSFKEVDKISLGTDDDSCLDVIGDDNFIITSKGNITEIKSDVVSSTLSINTSLYNTKKMPLYANDMYTGVYGIRLGSLGITSIDNNHTILFSKNDDDIRKYNINLIKDEIGLKVTGEFNKSDDVQIILDNFLDKKTYKMDTSDKYVSKYISEDGIKGKYYIYFRINGNIYKLYKYVTFY